MTKLKSGCYETRKNFIERPVLNLMVVSPKCAKKTLLSPKRMKKEVQSRPNIFLMKPKNGQSCLWNRRLWLAVTSRVQHVGWTTSAGFEGITVRRRTSAACEWGPRRTFLKPGLLKEHTFAVSVRKYFAAFTPCKCWTHSMFLRSSLSRFVCNVPDCMGLPSREMLFTLMTCWAMRCAWNQLVWIRDCS